MSVSHHSSEEFILILRVSNSSVCVCVVIFLPAHRGFVLQPELAGRSWPASWRSLPARLSGGRVAGGERPRLNCPRMQDHGWDGLGGACSASHGRAAHPTTLIALPSAIAHHRRCQAVRLSDWLWEMPACPCFWSRSGFGRWLAELVGEPSTVNPAMTYWPWIGAIVCWSLLQAFWELGPHRSFSLQPRTKFSSSFPYECPCVHTLIHTHANLFSFSPRTSHSRPPRARRLDLVLQAATPNVYLCTGAHAASARVELLRSLRLSVPSSSASTLPPSNLLATAMSVTTKHGQREGFSADGQPGSSKQPLPHALPRPFEFEHASFLRDSPKSLGATLPGPCSGSAQVALLREWLLVGAIALHVCASCGGFKRACSAFRPCSIMPSFKWGCFQITSLPVSPRMPHPPGLHISAVGQGRQTC